MYKVIHMIVLVLHDFCPGVCSIYEVLGTYRKTSFNEFQLMLQMLEVYGAGYTDDIDPIKYNVRQD